MYFNKRKFVEENIKKYYIGQTTRTIKCRAGKDGNKINLTWSFVENFANND